MRNDPRLAGAGDAESDVEHLELLESAGRLLRRSTLDEKRLALLARRAQSRQERRC